MLKNENTLLHITSAEDFRVKALETFKAQYEENVVYRSWVDFLKIRSDQVQCLEQIPFLPVSFFKTHRVYCGDIQKARQVFTSSGTTGSVPSSHFVADLSLYEQSFLKGFRLFYGEPSDYCILALLPGYLERSGSSLVYMVDRLIRESEHPLSGFYLRDYKKLLNTLDLLKKNTQKTIILGVTYALLDLCEHGVRLNNDFIIMETGGMKGNRPEMPKSELHAVLKHGLGVDRIHSEYGMTELLSQAYSSGDGLFEAPPWMRFLIREVDDPLAFKTDHRTGGVNVIDLANRYSCSFIATQDLGRLHIDNRLEIMGRFDHSDVRGCNLMLGNL